ncbi:hypothetical protein DFP72DRAFT_827547, partial [Ephemerocybe angulata]
MDTSALTNNGALPSQIPFFVGMPVILRSRNISTDLGLDNGTHVAKLAIVHFPTSKVHLEGLPPGYFPIEPISWSFTAALPSKLAALNGDVNLRVRRYQLPLQPAFAVTGHSAQGKTLPMVLASLREGGFGAYVAASRAKARTGLCIM